MPPNNHQLPHVSQRIRACNLFAIYRLYFYGAIIMHSSGSSFITCGLTIWRRVRLPIRSTPLSSVTEEPQRPCLLQQPGTERHTGYRSESSVISSCSLAVPLAWMVPFVSLSESPTRVSWNAMYRNKPLLNSSVEFGHLTNLYTHQPSSSSIPSILSPSNTPRPLPAFHNREGYLLLRWYQASASASIDHAI